MNKASVFETDYFGLTPNGTSKIMDKEQSVRVRLIQWLASVNVHRTQCKMMLEKFDELYPLQAEFCEPIDKLYDRLKD